MHPETESHLNYVRLCLSVRWRISVCVWLGVFVVNYNLPRFVLSFLFFSLPPRKKREREKEKG